MKHPLLRAGLVAALALASPATASTEAQPASSQTSTQRNPTGAVASEKAPSAKRTTGTATVTGSESSRRSAASRDDMTLDAITIEGEIDVPQVLFITARDQFRNTDFLHRLFLADVAAIGQDAARREGLGFRQQGETSPWKPSVR